MSITGRARLSEGCEKPLLQAIREGHDLQSCRLRQESKESRFSAGGTTTAPSYARPPYSRSCPRRDEYFPADTPRTLGLARHTNLPPVPDDLMRKQSPLVLRDHFHQVLFNCLDTVVNARGQFQAIGNPGDVRVHYHANIFLEPCSQHHIRRLPRHAREASADRPSHPVPVRQKPSTNFPRRSHDGFCLIAEKSSRADVRFQLLRLQRGESLYSWVFPKQLGSDHVYAYVGTLRRKNCGHHQFPGAVVVQGTSDIHG